LFYSSIFQMIIVFPFIVLKYFSFCCHSSHSVLCCNRLVYSCFVLFVKSDSIFILFNLFVPISVYSLFFYNLTFLISGSYFFMHSVFPVILSLLLLCLYVILSLIILFLYIILSLVILSFLLFCLYVILSLLCLSVSFHLFVALPLPFFPSYFGFIFTLSPVYFLIFLLEYLSI